MLWAHPKLLTYSIQNEPFIHVDGDVYIFNRLPAEYESAELIAQNAEVGSAYYKKMAIKFLNDNVIIPEILRKEIEKEIILSYNAGVLGGNDLNFIKEYCQIAFDFISTNKLNDTNSKISDVNYNILFEQILFRVLVAHNKKTVLNVIKQPIQDNGYTYKEFCDFYSVEKQPYMHIIGGHKRNNRICELLSRTLANRHPDYFYKIINLFSTEHLLFTDSHCAFKNPISETTNYLQQYNLILDSLLTKWKDIHISELLEQEKLSGNYFQFLIERAYKSFFCKFVIVLTLNHSAR
jgi:hypothetical protein